MNELELPLDLVQALGNISDRDQLLKLFRLERLPNYRRLLAHSTPQSSTTVFQAISVRSSEYQEPGTRRFWGFTLPPQNGYFDEIHTMNEFGWVCRTLPFAGLEINDEYSLPMPSLPEETRGYILSFGRRTSNNVFVLLGFEDASLVESLHAYGVAVFYKTLGEGGNPTLEAFSAVKTLCEQLEIKSSYSIDGLR